VPELGKLKKFTLFKQTELLIPVRLLGMVEKTIDIGLYFLDSIQNLKVQIMPG
jgi:hypothetical protein